MLKKTCVSILVFISLIMSCASRESTITVDDEAGTGTLSETNSSVDDTADELSTSTERGSDTDTEASSRTTDKDVATETESLIAETDNKDTATETASLGETTTDSDTGYSTGDRVTDEDSEDRRDSEDLRGDSAMDTETGTDAEGTDSHTIRDTGPGDTDKTDIGGLAEKYPGDEGIDNDPDVVFVEKFEQASLADLLSRWEDRYQTELISFSSDTPAPSKGAQSAFFDSNAYLYQRLLPGYSRLYLRFYVKFETECSEVHHGVWLGGHNPSTAWPWPRAGERPVGDERWSTGVEPMAGAWAWDFYTYWMHMRTNPDTYYWGNTFTGRPSPSSAVRGEWVCVELMVKMNDPVHEMNGEQAFWIDGALQNHLGKGFPNGEWIWDGFYPEPAGAPFEGFQWRSDPALNINYIWLNHYVDNDTKCGAWFDDLVIATRYIGPIAAE